MNIELKYYSNGKLLITGEYLVLDGALALAVPTKLGQSLTVKSTTEKHLHWKSVDQTGKIWLEKTILLPIVLRKSDVPVVTTLKNILLQAQIQNPDFLKNTKGLDIKTHLEFPRNWGLGSSSTLINNIARWADVNPYQLLWNTMGGSGYDIACAESESSILYQLIEHQPIVKKVNFDPIFTDQLYLIHLNQKQKSSKEVNRYKSLSITQKKESIRLVSEISNLLLQVQQLDDFALLLKEYEKIMSGILQLPVVQTQFKDYFGQLKSLGAWGGDFILATGNEETPRYFKEKGFETIIPFKDMVKKI